MAIIETFYMLFKSNAQDVKKGNEEIEKSTKKTQNTINSLADSTQSVGNKFISLAASFAGLIASVISVHKLVSGFTSTLDYTNQLGLLSKQLGVSVESLDEWSNAVRFAGGTAEGFISSLKSLSTHFNSNAKVALQALPLLADSFSKIGKLRSQQYGKALGLDEFTILLLQQGRREVEDIVKRMKELGNVTKENTEISNKYRIELLKNELAFRKVYLSLFSELIPGMTKVLEIFTKFVRYLGDHKDLVIGALLGIGSAATIFLAPFIIASLPILKIIAAISLLISLFAIAYEDIKAYSQGHDSLLGRIEKRWTITGSIVKSVIKSIIFLIGHMIEGLKFAAYWIDKISSLFSDKNITSGLKNLGSGNLGKAQNFIGLAAESRIASHPQNNLFTQQAFANNHSVNTGDITINTQATNSQEIADNFQQKLIDRFTWHSNNQFADGNVI